MDIMPRSPAKRLKLNLIPTDFRLMVEDDDFSQAARGLGDGCHTVDEVMVTLLSMSSLASAS